MRAILRSAVAATALAVASPLAAPFALAAPQEAPSEPAQAPDLTLTQKQIDGVISAQPELQAIEAKSPQGSEDKPDPKVQAKIESVITKNGFSSPSQFADVSATIDIVLAGMDQETKTYVGPEAVIKKQIDEVKADKSMPPKEKKEALDELSAELQPAARSKPSPTNIDLVSKNYDKLNASMQQQGAKD